MKTHKTLKKKPNHVQTFETKSKKPSLEVDLGPDLLTKTVREIQQLATHLTTKYNAATGLDVRARAEIGRKVVEFGEKSKRPDVQAWKLIGPMVSLGTSTIRDCVYVARAFSDVKLKTILKRKMRDGFTLTFSDFVVLASELETEKQRDTWVNRCLKQGLSTRELKDAIKKQREPTPAAEEELPPSIVGGENGSPPTFVGRFADAAHQLGMVARELPSQVDALSLEERIEIVDNISNVQKDLISLRFAFREMPEVADPIAEEADLETKETTQTTVPPTPAYRSRVKGPTVITLTGSPGPDPEPLRIPFGKAVTKVKQKRATVTA